MKSSLSLIIRLPNRKTFKKNKKTYKFSLISFVHYLMIVPSHGAPAAFDSSVSICIAKA